MRPRLWAVRRGGGPRALEGALMSNELRIAGMGVSSGVVSTIVAAAAEKVEGVAAIYGQDIASGLIAMLTSKPQPNQDAVECEVADDDTLVITVHLAVFFGYPFTKLAADVRAAVAQAIDAQIGVSASEVNVCIDELIFPKE